MSLVRDTPRLNSAEVCDQIVMDVTIYYPNRRMIQDFLHKHALPQHFKPIFNLHTKKKQTNYIFQSKTKYVALE
jgi:hypothetical protein